MGVGTKRTFQLLDPSDELRAGPDGGSQGPVGEGGGERVGNTGGGGAFSLNPEERGFSPSDDNGYLLGKSCRLSVRTLIDLWVSLGQTAEGGG